MLKYIKGISLGLIDLGYKKGDYIGILAIPSPMWTMVDLAIMAIGAICVPLFPNISEENFSFEVQQTNIKSIFVFGNQAWEILKNYRSLFIHIFNLDEKDESRQATSLNTLIQRGEKLDRQKPDLFNQLQAQIRS